MTGHERLVAAARAVGEAIVRLGEAVLRIVRALQAFVEAWRAPAAALARFAQLARPAPAPARGFWGPWRDPWRRP